MLVGSASIVVLLSVFGPYFVGGILVGGIYIFMVVVNVADGGVGTAKGRERAILLFTVGDVGAAPRSSTCLSFCE